MVRVLLDENLPVELAALLSDCEVQTAAQAGLLRLKNGDFLASAEGRFDVLLTMDRGILFQHDHRSRCLRIGVIQAVNSRIESLNPIICQIERFLTNTSTGGLALIRQSGIEPFEL